MGCDGGSIPKRAEMVKEKQKEEQPDKEQTKLVKWTTCSLSKQLLVEPIYGDALGNLYNYDSILEYLLDKNKFGTSPNIKRLKDVVKLNIKRDENGFHCPITKKEMNGSFEFVYLKCGCCMSSNALNNIKTKNCLVCSREFDPSDIVVINPTDAKLQEMIKEQQSKASLKKKSSSKQLKNGDNKRKIDMEDRNAKKINIVVPDITEALEAVEKKIKSNSLKSLYEKSIHKETFLTKGTFNRYAGA